jgi:hypothetical protein
MIVDANHSKACNKPQQAGKISYRRIIVRPDMKVLCLRARRRAGYSLSRQRHAKRHPLRSKPGASRLKYFSRRRGMIDSVSFQFCPIATYPDIHEAGLRRVREQGREAFAHACRQRC